MDLRNPYAPPRAEIEEVKPSDCYRDGKFVVVKTGSDFPPRCIKCNGPVKLPVKPVKLYWHSPWLYLLILLNILIYLIAALIVRNKAKVSPGLCELHAARRFWTVLAVVGVAGISCAAGFGLLATKKDEGLGFFLFFFAILVLLVGGLALRKVYAKRITDQYAKIGGCKEPFLASLERLQWSPWE